VRRLDSGYASKPKNLASAACGYLQGITVYVGLVLGTWDVVATIGQSY
jgi:hypothetical protein